MQATQLRERKISIKYSHYRKDPSPTLIKEGRKTYTRHDQLFTELIHTFFQEFLEVFFPDVHEAIDFHTITPLSEEVHTDLIEGDTRRLDIVVQVKLKQDDALIIVHIEPLARLYHIR